MSVQAKPSDTTVKLSESGGFAFGVEYGFVPKSNKILIT